MSAIVPLSAASFSYSFQQHPSAPQKAAAVSSGIPGKGQPVFSGGPTRSIGSPVSEKSRASEPFDSENWRVSMPGMPAFSGGEIGTGSLSGRFGPLARQLLAGAQDALFEDALPGMGQEEKPGKNSAGAQACETCESRRYQDGSDDPGVSFQTPGKIDPNAAAGVVRSHELEHVFREQAKAEREGREVVFQSVILHTGICPECGRAYVSGGTTRTVTRPAPSSVSELFQVGLTGSSRPGGVFSAAA